MDLPKFLDFLKPKAVKRSHKLKWPLPEMRLTVPLKDVNEAVASLKKSGAKFLGGGEFIDQVYRKEYAPNVYAYYLLRTDAKTRKETVLFEGYMIQETEKLNLEAESGYSFSQSLPEMGYEKAFDRMVTERRFSSGFLRVVVLEVEGLGDFLELAIPQTKVDKTRELQQKSAFSLLKKMGFKENEVIPADALTIQGLSQQQPEKKEKKKGDLF
jgi:adenylate cyclase class IV